ncbi:MAG: hypothetical protein ACKVZ0_06540 [Gemmatimonadales bacterium]
MTTARSIARLVIAALLAVSLLPIANWIPSERATPWYGVVATNWLVLGGGCLAGAVLVGWLGGRAPARWRTGALAGLLGRFDPIRPPALALVTFLALAAYLAVAVGIFQTRPILIDEIVFLFQARSYTAGRLWLPVDSDPAFRSVLHLVEHGGRWFGHFPPGWPALLAVGEWVGRAWLIGPLVGAATVAAWGRVLVRLEERPSVRGGALLLFALAPFVAFMAGSQMNHSAALLWILVALVAWLALRAGAGMGAAVGAGFALGMAAITRPLDALAFGLPAAIWVLGWARAGGRGRFVVAMAVAALVPLAGMLAVNAATTGSAWQSGYQLLWGPNVGLGFHPAPYGPAHTPSRGFELVALYLLRLNVYLFEAPVPGLLAAGLALILVPRWGPIDRYLLVSAGALLLGYFAYWHDGFFLGPRFVYPLVPLVTLWTARLPSAVGAGFGDGPRRAAAALLGFATLGALAIGIPVRAGQHAAFQPALRFDADRAATAAGIRDAVVLVRESWGSQLLARLWALGATRPQAERFYRNVDSCRLDHAIDSLERAGRPGGLERLVPLMSDSARLVASPFSPDTSERVLDGARYDQRCAARINEDRAGTALLAPTVLSRRADLVFVRDLQWRNRVILEREPSKAVYLLRRLAAEAAPSFVPVSRDSILGLTP